MRPIFIFIILVFLSACGKSNIDVAGLPEGGPHALTSISVLNNQLLFEGEDLDGVKGIRITGTGGVDESFQIESSSVNNLVSNGLRDITFDVSQIYNLIITDAFGASSYSISFTPSDGSITAAKLDDMDAETGQFLQWNGSVWTPADLSGTTYMGSWNADSNSPDLTALSPDSGAYYIVSVAGTTALGGASGTDSWSIADWAIYNDEDDQWEKISGATGVVSFNSRTGTVTPQTNDYTWAQINKTSSSLKDIADVNISSTPSASQVLMWDDTNSEWDPADIDSVISDSSDITTNSITSSAQGGVVISPYGVGASQTGELRFNELAANGSNYVAFRSPDTLADNYVFTLPNSYGTSGQFLQTNGSGLLTWGDASSGGGTGDFKADGSVAMTSDFNAGGNSITNVVNVDGVDVSALNSTVSGHTTDIAANSASIAANITSIAVNSASIAAINTSLVLNDDDSSNTITVQAPSTLASNYVLTLPSTTGGSGEFLKTDGSGTLSWSGVSSLDASDGSPASILTIDEDGNFQVGNTVDSTGFVFVSNTDTTAGAIQLVSSAQDSATAGFDIQFSNIYGAYGGIKMSNPSSNVTNLEFSNWGETERVVRMGIYGTAGSIGIGTDSPVHTLDVVGTAGLSTGTAWTNTSDIRLKDVHGEYERGLDEVMELRTIRFNYKKENPLGYSSSREQIGFVAQEVEKVIPEAVSEGADGYLRLNVDPIHWALVNAVQELEVENSKIREENEKIKNALCQIRPSLDLCR